MLRISPGAMYFGGSQNLPRPSASSPVFEHLDDAEIENFHDRCAVLDLGQECASARANGAQLEQDLRRFKAATMAVLSLAKRSSTPPVRWRWRGAGSGSTSRRDQGQDRGRTVTVDMRKDAGALDMRDGSTEEVTYVRTSSGWRIQSVGLPASVFLPRHEAEL